MQTVLPPEEPKLLELTRHKIVWLWELSKRSWPAVPESFRLKEGFIKYVTDPGVVILQVSDGVVYIDEIEVGVKAKVHPVFGKEKVPRDDRIEATRWAAMWIFNTLGVHRIWGETPEVQPLLRTMTRFARDVGFTHEGVLRDGLFFDGKYFNSHVHGLLDSDLEVRQNGRWIILVKAKDAKGPDAGTPPAGPCELLGGQDQRRDTGPEPPSIQRELWDREYSAESGGAEPVAVGDQQHEDESDRR